MTTSAIAVSGLRKAFGDKTVLDGIDLDVPTGTVFSLLGPNGAGKTTTVNVLTTLMTADAGTIRVAGHDVATETKAVRAAIGVTGQFAAVDELLTGQENLQLMADLKHLGSAEARPLVTLTVTWSRPPGATRSSRVSTASSTSAAAATESASISSRASSGGSVGSGQRRSPTETMAVSSMT